MDLLVLWNQRAALFRTRMIRFFVRGKSSLADISAVFRGRAGNHRPYFGIAPRKFWFVAKAHPYEVMDHQNLAVAVGSRSNPDRGYA